MRIRNQVTGETGSVIAYSPWGTPHVLVDGTGEKFYWYYWIPIA